MARSPKCDLPNCQLVARWRGYYRRFRITYPIVVWACGEHKAQLEADPEPWPIKARDPLGLEVLAQRMK